MDEVNQLSSSFPEVSWVGVATSRTDPNELAAFIDYYKPSFPMVIDEGGEFSSALSARATPNVYVFERANNDAEHNAVLVDLYLPYSRGMAPLFKLRE